MTKIIFIYLLLLAVSARDDPKYDIIFGNKQPTVINFKQQLYWFDQVTDHYDYHNTQYWKQRYWVSNQTFKSRLGTVFLYICGEWICSGVPSTRGWTGVLGQKLNSIVIALQHRFYGQSLPFGKDSFSLQNMKLLSSEQALRDIANFIQYVKKNKLFGITNQPWVIAGGSYAGALVAWFRYKYPHLVIASIASSAVINAIQNFEQFDQQIYQSSNKSGDFCSQALRDISQRVQDILYTSQSDALQFKTQFFGGEFLSNEEFLFFWADSIVMPIQYGSRVQFCQGLKGKTADQQLQYFVENAKKIDVFEYSTFYLRNQTFTQYFLMYLAKDKVVQGLGITNTVLNMAGSKHFPAEIQLDFYRWFCAAAYGDGTWAKVTRKNTEYGGINAAASRIYFSNGVQDPWRWASLQQNKQKELIARVINCDNMAHCVDMGTPTANDCQDLTKARNEQLFYLKKWIGEYWQEYYDRKNALILQKKSNPW